MELAKLLFTGGPQDGDRSESGRTRGPRAASSGTRQVRQWRRYQAVLLLAEGHSAVTVARMLGASLAGVYNWAARWRQAGLAGLAEGVHAGRVRHLDQAGEHWLDGLLASDPQAHGYQSPGWTVPLLLHEARAAGYTAARSRRCVAPSGGWVGAGSGPSTSWADPIQSIPKKSGADRADGRRAGCGRGDLGGR